MSNTDTIVLIHGLWMTPRSWEHWAERYEGRGHKVLAPAWPGLEGEVEELRRDPSPLTKLDLAQVVDHYDGIIRGLDRPPIIMGHSLGGAVTQLLLDRGFGSAGVGVSSGTVKGVRDLPLSTLRAARPVLGNPFNRGKASPLSAKQFRYAFGNTLSQEASDEIYERYYVPAANSVLFDAAFANLHRNPTAKVDFAKADRAPLLFIGFESDHVVPAKATRHNAEKYDDSKAVIAFNSFPGRPHFPGAPAGRRSPTSHFPGRPSTRDPVSPGRRPPREGRPQRSYGRLSRTPGPTGNVQRRRASPPAQHRPHRRRLRARSRVQRRWRS